MCKLWSNCNKFKSVSPMHNSDMLHTHKANKSKSFSESIFLKNNKNKEKELLHLFLMRYSFCLVKTKVKLTWNDFKKHMSYMKYGKYDIW